MNLQDSRRPLLLEEPLPDEFRPKRGRVTEAEMAALAGISEESLRELVMLLREMLAADRARSGG